MTPTSYCYLDYYQATPKQEPLAIGGFLPLEKVYSFEPIPDVLNADEAKHILGVQGNLWTEYIPTSEQAEYMVFPRGIAIAESGWTNKELKNYDDFGNRLKIHFKRLEILNVNACQTGYYQIKASSKSANGKVNINLANADAATVIRYNTDGTTPNVNSTIYKNDIETDKNIKLRAATFSKSGEKLSNSLEKDYFVNLSTGKKYTLTNQPKAYTGGETYALTNGLKANELPSDAWVGFDGKDLEAVIDLDSIQTIKRVSVAFFKSSGQWIFQPRKVEVYLSEDGKTYKLAEKIEMDTNPPAKFGIDALAIGIGGEKARFIKIFAENYGNLPENHAGYGNKAWLFVDEIGVE
jgi:hexosaminidase